MIHAGWLSSTRECGASARTRSPFAAPRSRRAQRALGFTLLEILLALALLAFVMLGVWAALAGATRITRSANALMAQSERVRTVQQFLRRYVSVAAMQPYIISATSPARMFHGAATSMQYVAPLPAQSGHSGLYLQTISLVNGDDGRIALRLEYQPYSGDRPANRSPVQHRLLADLRGGKFQFLVVSTLGKPAAWRDDWDAANGLPLAVRIQLDPAWQARVPFPDMVIPLRSGEGSGTRIGSAP